VKGARVVEYLGRSINMSEDSTLEVNPDNTRSVQLKQWYESLGPNKDEKLKPINNGAGKDRP